MRSLLYWTSRNTPPATMQINSAQRLFNRWTRRLLPIKAAGLLKPSVSGKDVTRSKQQHATSRYYKRGAGELHSLESGDTERVEPWRTGRKE